MNTTPRKNNNTLTIPIGIFVLAIIILIFVILVQKNSDGSLFTAQFVFPVIAILAIIASILTLTLVAAVFASFPKGPSSYALGMPQGSIRALIALSLITSFIISAIFLFTTLNDTNFVKQKNLSQQQFDKLSPTQYRNLTVDTIYRYTAAIEGKESKLERSTIPVYSFDMIVPVSEQTNDFAKQLITLLGTLVIAVSAFYFGSRATEQGAESAAKIFNKFEPKEPTDSVPELIVKNAIDCNKTHWMSLYKNVIDIVPGKKKRNDTTSDTNCIVFKVGKKQIHPEADQTIPTYFTYASNDGTAYNIPTDVIELSGDTQSNSTVAPENHTPKVRFESLSESEQNTVISDSIKSKSNEWKLKYKNFLYASHGRKVKEGKPTAINAIIFNLRKKEAIDVLGEAKIPDYISHSFNSIYYEIPTDIIQTGDIPEAHNIYNRAIGSGISRVNSNDFGTIGLKAFRRNSNNEIEYFVLSCFHVLFNYEMENGIGKIPDKMEWKISQNILKPADPKAVCPCYFDDNDSQGNIIGDICEGTLNNYIDAALVRLVNESTIKSFLNEKNIYGPQNVYDVLPGYGDANRIVYIYGRGSHLREGSIKYNYIESDTAIPIKYKIPGLINHIPMNGLIELTPFSKPGDSGAPVFTLKNELIGIIIGGGNTASYAIPIRTLINSFLINIITTKES